MMVADRQQLAAWVRENLPQCSAVAERFRAEFGDVRMVWASEGGHVLGKPGPDGVKLSDAAFAPWQPMPERRR